MSKRILLIIESLDVDKFSGARVNVGFARSLHALGYDVTVLHYSQKNIAIEGIPNVSLIQENRSSLMFFLSRSQRVIQRALRIDLSTFLENIFGFSFTFFNDSKSIRSALEKSFSNHQLIITLSQGASFRPHHAVLKASKFHDKWMAYIHDPFPFSCYPQPYTFLDKGHRQKKKFMEKVSESSKLSGFPSLFLKDWMSRFFPNFEQTAMILPHQSTEFKVDNLENSLELKFDPKNFTILHAGNLLKERDPYSLIEGFLLFLNNNPSAEENSTLLFVGPASYHKEKLEEKYKDFDALVLYLESAPFQQVHKLQNSVSVNVILEAQAEINPFLPGKFPICVKTQKPILYVGSNKSESKRLLGVDYPYVSEIGDAETIADKIQLMYNDWIQTGNSFYDYSYLNYYLSLDYVKEQIDKIE